MSDEKLDGIAMHEVRKYSRLRVLVSAVLMFCLTVGLELAYNPRVAHAQGYNALQECLKISNVDIDVHNCMDNYLDLMDDNITDISEYIARDLPDAALDQFQVAQQAFFEYRKQNCLWYLEFSSPRATAEQIAKNCLANMSQARLSELQLLIATDNGKAATLRGFYVYGANRNSFQPCGSDQRYWVEGDNEQVGQLQQDYLSQSTASLQLLYAELRGSLEPNQDYAEHSGVVKLVALSSLKPPSEIDCKLPKSTSVETLAAQPAAKPVVVPAPEPTPTPEPSQEPEQILRAYFGDWLAECQQKKSDFSCDLSVGFSGNGVNENTRPEMLLTRKSTSNTLLYLEFPEREIDATEKIRWRVDTFNLGDILASRIRVDEAGTRQLVHERRFVSDELMPLFIEGTEVSVEVLANIDDESGEKFSASLSGLTKALSFADSFIESGGEL